MSASATFQYKNLFALLADLIDKSFKFQLGSSLGLPTIGNTDVLEYICNYFSFVY